MEATCAGAYQESEQLISKWVETDIYGSGGIDWSLSSVTKSSLERWGINGLLRIERWGKGYTGRI